MVQKVGIASGIFLLGYAVLSLVLGQRSVAFGNLAQLLPPIAAGLFALWLARRCRRQVRVFWQLTAAHALMWAIGQGVWTYLDVFAGGVPVISPTDPLFFISSIPLAAALYGRPERDRPRWLFDIVLLDIVLIALFSAFLYIYFVVTIAATGGREDLYNANLTQLLNARSLLLALWATWVWRTSSSPAWRRMLGVYALALFAALGGAIVYDLIERAGAYAAGGIADIVFMLPYVGMMVAAALAYDSNLFEPEEEAAPLSKLPVVSLIAITLLIAIPALDEVSRRLLTVSEVTEQLRTRVALAMMIPFGIVVAVREFLSRRALIRAAHDLAATKQQLTQREKLAAVGQLVSGLAHELNNPLQGVLGYTELLLASRPKSLEADELRAVRDNANRAAGIVRNLLTFAGRTTPSRGWLPINRVVRDAIAARDAELEASGIELRFEAADRLPSVYVDSARIKDVIGNLIQNAEAAIAARRGGKGSVRAARGEIIITTRLELEPERILIEVADNGIGLKDDDLHRVFEPFFTTRESGEGAGLGLSVCYGIVREHGGEITATNGPVGGAVFTVELPVMAESLAGIGALSGQPSPNLDLRRADAAHLAFSTAGLPGYEGMHRRPKALVVDDEESNAALVRRVLDGAGYDVESTTLSRRALVMIERTAYDAVIADVRMPELSGQELYGRACQIRPEMARRFIFITGDIDGQDTRAFLEETHCSYLLKPFNLERLTAAVDMLTASGQQASRPAG
jgi:signal transduction histidine kinase/ActR/RegA family two-component response regulator